MAYWQIQEQEIEVRDCKSLLHLRATEVAESSSDSEKKTLWAEKLEVAERLEYQRVVTKLDLENSRLSQQLHW